MQNTHWIWAPGIKEYVEEKPYLVYFRKEVVLEREINRRMIRISADTRYKLYINDRLINVGPAKGDDKVWYYDELEVTPFLKTGKNTIAVEVLRYPLKSRDGNYSLFRTHTPGLYLEDISEQAAPSTTFTADESWKCHRAENYNIVAEAGGFSPLMILEKRSGEDKLHKWKTEFYNDSEWEYALEYSPRQLAKASCPADLYPREIPHVILNPRHFESVVEKEPENVKRKWNALIRGEESVIIPPHTYLHVEINAGEEMCGFLNLRMLSGKDSTVKILTAEAYYQDRIENALNMPLKGERCDWEKGYLKGYTDSYHVGGFGEDGSPEIFDPFWFRTFRFIRLDIETKQEALTVQGFDYLETGYPLEVGTTAETSDPSMKDIWEISLRTLRRCMHETYIDCPFYEQLQYAMDSRSEILYTYAVSADDRLARQCMDDFRRSQRADGLLYSCYPQVLPNVIPGFSIYYICMVYDHMMYFGDYKLVKHHLAAIDQILEFFDDHLDERGLVGKIGGFVTERYWSFIDWTFCWEKTYGLPPAGLVGPITMESMLYAYGLQCAASLCDYVGRSSTAEEYRSRAEKIRAAVRKYCKDEQGVFLDGPGVEQYSQHCQVFAVLTGMVSVEDGRRLLLNTLEHQEKYAQYTVSMALYLFRALELTDLYDYTDKLWDTWRKMLDKHLTTCVENDVFGRSDCHAWGALILYELPSVILGVRPAEPGYEKIRIAPVTGMLTWAKGEVLTKWGNIKVSWIKNEAGELSLEYEAEEDLKTRIVTDF